MWVTLALNILKKIWPYLVIALLVIALWLIWGMYQEAEKSRKREKQNVEEAFREHSEKVKEFELDKDVFRHRLESKYSALIDSLKNVKPKQVTKVHYIETTKEIVDTTEVLRIKYDTIYMNKAHFSDDCGLSITTSWRDGASVATFDIRDTSRIGIVTYKTVPWFKIWKKQRYDVSVVNQTCETVIYNEQISNIKYEKD